MQTPKARKSGSSEAPQKVAPRAARHLKTTALEIDSASSSSQACRTPKGRSPKTVERRSPRSPVIEHQKKHPNKVSELESQISQLREDLKKVKDKLILSESCKRKAQQDAEDSKKELLFVSSKLDESQKQLQALSSSEKTCVCDSVNSVALASAVNEIPRPKVGKILEENQRIEYSKGLDSEFESMKSELGDLRCALETAVTALYEEQVHSTLRITSAYELVEEMKSAPVLKEAEVEAALKKSTAEIEDLKAKLMGKESNEGLNLSLEKERILETKLNESKEYLADLKADLMDKETELQNILEENEALRSEIKEREIDSRKQCDGARAAEREALIKLGLAMEEADKVRKRAGRVGEQLEAVQTVNSEMETELRKLKVQSSQWRKAAEAAAAMISTSNNGKFMDRTASLDSNYGRIMGKTDSPCAEDIDYDFSKKKNGNMLKKIGVLWKKPQK